MITRLRILTVALWLISLILPTVESSTGEILLGYELLFAATTSLIAIVPFGLLVPFHILSFVTNLFIIIELIKLTVYFKREYSAPNIWLTLSILLLNIFVGIRYSSQEYGSISIGFPGLLELPGFYTWLGAFIIMFIISIANHKEFLNYIPGILKRVGITAVISVVTIMISASIIFIANEW